MRMKNLLVNIFSKNIKTNVKYNISSTRFLFFLFSCIFIMSSFFSIQLVETQLDTYYFMIVFIGIIIQLLTYILFGYSAYTIRSKRYLYGLICLIMSIVFLIISIVGTAGFFIQQRETINTKNYKKTKEYKMLTKDYNSIDGLYNNEIKNKNALEENLNTLIKENKNNVKKIKDEFNENHLKEKAQIENTYKYLIQKKEKRNFITTKGGVEDLRKERNVKLSTLEKNIEKAQVNELNKLSINIEEIKKDIKKSTQKIEIYKKEKNILYNEIKQSKDQIAENGYAIVIEKIIPNEEIAEMCTNYLFLIISICIEISAWLICNDLFINRNYNIMQDVTSLFKKKQPKKIKEERIMEVSQDLETYIKSIRNEKWMKLKDLKTKLKENNVLFDEKKLGANLRRFGCKSKISGGFTKFLI